jgi:hypothetical protein
MLVNHEACRDLPQAPPSAGVAEKVAVTRWRLFWNRSLSNSPTKTIPAGKAYHVTLLQLFARD